MSGGIYRSGMAAILGRPNVGKSTLLNRLVGAKLSIVSDKPQTTRRRLLGVLTGEDFQALLVDTPGMHKPRDLLNQFMVEEVKAALEDVDLAATLVEAGQPLGKGDRFLLDMVSEAGCPNLIVLNKIDLVGRDVLSQRTREVREILPDAAVVPVSALTAEGCDGLRRAIRDRLPEGPPYFPEEQLSDQTERAIAAEIIREAVYRHTRQEIPHATAVVIEDWKDPEQEGQKAVIHATIHVEHESQKGIVVGRGGSMLKRIGTEARKDIENLTGRPVFLQLHVKVRLRWRKDPAALREFGYQNPKGGGS